MKRIFTCFAFFSLTIFSFSLMAQDVVSYRITDLQNELYVIDGDAIIEQLSDGTSRLRLSEDYKTPWGPDVRIILNNTVSPNGAFEVVNLTDINHFEGALTVALPTGFDIEEYNFVVFFCVTFNQLWASGQLGAVEGDSGPSCSASATFGVSGASTYDICPSDGSDVSISFSNSINAVAGTEYVYLITDENEIVIDFTTGASYDFAGSSDNTNRVYGMSFTGNMDIQVGMRRRISSADGCFEHSSDTEFITVTKGACDAAFVCEASLTATTDWMTSVDICPTDGEADWIELRNNLFIPPGNNYVYLITDAQGILTEVTMDTLYNFEGSSEIEQRVYGMHYDGTLNPQIGQDRMMTTASGCLEHSGDNLFLTINKTAQCGVTSTFDAQLANEIDVFPNPSNGIVNVDYNGLDVEFDEVIVFDLTGKKVKALSKSASQISIEQAGMYLIQFSNSQVTTTKKILIQ